MAANLAALATGVHGLVTLRLMTAIDTRAASRRILAASERELQRIVLDMHDGPVQDIFAALSQLQLLERSLTATPALGERVQRAIQALERALGEIRSFIGAFRPPGFERRELGPIIDGLVVQHEALTGQAVELTLAPDVGDCNLPTKIALYRILQEALANGHRHSGAELQRVEMRREDGTLVLTVADDGQGFDPSAVLAREADVGVEGGHFGLRGIQDRLEMLGGTFRIASAPGRGCTLTVTLPAE
ncbi:MAG TPA: sensor histidine kinase [Gemmatimonadales bacterium]